MNRKHVALALASSLIFTPLAAAELEAYIVESGPEEVEEMIYTWGDPDTTPYYQDAQSYPDVGLMICRSDGDVQQDYYVGVEYSLGGESQLVSYGTDNTLEPADDPVTFDGGLCRMTSIGGLTISPSEISGTPETKIAAFPGEASALVAEQVDGSDAERVETGSVMSGGYSGSMSYDHESNSISLDVSSISVDSNIGTETFSPGTDGRGVSESRPLIVGVCGDSSGDSCNGLVEKKTDSSFPESFGFDVDEDEVNDQNVYTRYGLANSKNIDSIDIGADASVQGLSVDSSTVFYSQTQGVSFSISNSGNVPITSEFEVEASITGNGEVVDSRSFTVSDGLEPGESESFSYDWEAFDESGSYTVEVTADTDNDLAELNELSSSTRSFSLEAVAFPEVIVDGVEKSVEDTEFASAGSPYNFTLVMQDSDNNTLDNSEITITEEDGMDTLVPHQRLEEDSFTDMMKTSTFTTDENGTASITFTPTGNVLLADRYNETDIQDNIDYSLQFTGTHSGDDLTFIVDEEPTSTYPLEVENPGSLDEKEASSDLPNLDGYVKAVMNGVYTVFTEFWGAVT